jgi:hypothetical protein
VTSATFDYHLPNGLSHRANTPEAVRALIGEILEGRRGLIDATERERLFARHLAATQGALACDRVLDVLVANGYAECAPPRTAVAPWLKSWLVCKVRTMGKRMNSRRANHRNSAAYHAHRFPEVSVAELNARIARFGQELGRFQSVRAEARSPYVFSIRDLNTATRSSGASIRRTDVHASQPA